MKRIMGVLIPLVLFAFGHTPSFANDRPCDNWSLKSVIVGELADNERPRIIVPKSVEYAQPKLLLILDTQSIKEAGDSIWNGEQRRFEVWLGRVNVSVVKSLGKSPVIRIYLRGCNTPDSHRHVIMGVEEVVVIVFSEESKKSWDGIIDEAWQRFSAELREKRLGPLPVIVDEK